MYTLRKLIPQGETMSKTNVPTVFTMAMVKAKNAAFKASEIKEAA